MSFFNGLAGLIWAMCRVSDYSIKRDKRKQSFKAARWRVTVPMSASFLDNLPSKLWTSAWSVWRTSRLGPAWTMRKMRTRMKSEPTHSHSFPAGGNLLPPRPLRRGSQGEPGPPPRPHCLRAPERRLQADLSIRSRASLALRMHLLDRNQLEHLCTGAHSVFHYW